MKFSCKEIFLGVKDKINVWLIWGFKDYPYPPQGGRKNLKCQNLQEKNGALFGRGEKPPWQRVWIFFGKTQGIKMLMCCWLQLKVNFCESFLLADFWL